MQEPDRVFLKDGTTEWFPQFQNESTYAAYPTYPDILWLSLGQWIKFSENDKEESFCELVEDVFKMFTNHPANVKIWMNIPRVRTNELRLAQKLQQCEQNLTFLPNMYYFDLFEYTSYFQNIFWGDGYHLLVEHQRVMMLNALDILC